MALDPIENQLRQAQFQELARRSQSLANTLANTARQSGSVAIGLLAFNASLKAQTQSMNNNFRLLAAERRAKQEELRQLQAKGPLTRQEDAQRRLLITQIQGLTEDMRQNRADTKMLKFNKITETVEMVADSFKVFADGLRNFVNSIYKTQMDVGVGLGAGLYVEGQARIASVLSKIPGVDGPILETQELVDTYSAFTKEFGTILQGGEARELAETAKRAGVGAEILVKAQRAFLTAGGNLANLQSVYAKQFIQAGLTEAQALKFAADNANLVAIAGIKYADSLARAAANATKIGVSLEKTSGFFDGVVDDFEGALEKTSALSAMGFQLDYSQLTRLAGAGTEEERQQGLIDIFKENRSLLDNIQRDAFLRRQVEQTFAGIDIAEIIRMAKGEAATPKVETINELQLKQLERIGNILEQTSKAASFGSKLLNVGIEAAKGAAVGAVVGGGIGSIPSSVIGAFAMGGKAAMTEFGAGRAAGGLITGPGTATSDNILTPTSPGEYVINARATQAYGVDFLDNINRGQFNQNNQPTPVNNIVNVNLNELKEEFRNLAAQMKGMSINMDGNTVGQVVWNSSTPLDRVAAY